MHVSQRKKSHDAYLRTLGSRSEPRYVCALKVMPSYAGENSMAHSCVYKLTVIELKLGELIVKPHAYALNPQICNCSPNIDETLWYTIDLTIVYNGSSITVC